MKLIEEASLVNQEIQPKLEQITALTTQARKLLVDHGQPIPNKWNFWDKLLFGPMMSPVIRDKYPILHRQLSRQYKQISRQIDGIEVQMFSIAGTEETTPMVVSISVSGKSLVLKGESSFTQDENNPGSPNPLSRMSLDDLNAWGAVIQSVEDSLRFNQ